MRLIDADVLKEQAYTSLECKSQPCKVVDVNDIDEAPTVDAVPVYMVKQMRDAQKRYFRTRDADALQESKQLERDIDRLISNDGTVQRRLF